MPKILIVEDAQDQLELFAKSFRRCLAQSDSQSVCSQARRWIDERLCHIFLLWWTLCSR